MYERPTLFIRGTSLDAGKHPRRYFRPDARAYVMGSHDATVAPTEDGGIAPQNGSGAEPAPLMSSSGRMLLSLDYVHHGTAQSCSEDVWADTAQLDFRNSETRSAMAAVLCT